MDKQIEEPTSLFECNGNGTHIAIRYGSPPCPLCASHRLIRLLQDALRVYWGSDSCDYDHGPPADDDNGYFEDGELCNCRAHQAWWALQEAGEGDDYEDYPLPRSPSPSPGGSRSKGPPLQARICSSALSVEGSAQPRTRGKVKERATGAGLVQVPSPIDAGHLAGPSRRAGASPDGPGTR